jgi:hypothetical protein
MLLNLLVATRFPVVPLSTLFRFVMQQGQSESSSLRLIQQQSDDPLDGSRPSLSCFIPQTLDRRVRFHFHGLPPLFGVVFGLSFQCRYLFLGIRSGVSDKVFALRPGLAQEGFSGSLQVASRLSPRFFSFQKLAQDVFHEPRTPATHSSMVVCTIQGHGDRYAQTMPDVAAGTYALHCRTIAVGHPRLCDIARRVCEVGRMIWD